MSNVGILCRRMYLDIGTTIRPSTERFQLVSGTPGTEDKQTSPLQFNVMDFFDGPHDLELGFAFTDDKVNSHFEWNQGSFGSRSYGVDLGETVYRFSVQTRSRDISRITRAVATILAHEIGHNLGLKHTSTGIMSPSVNVGNPDTSFDPNTPPVFTFCATQANP